jgi:hypothetical protein
MTEYTRVKCVNNPINKNKAINAPRKGFEYIGIQIGENIVICPDKSEDGKYKIGWGANLFESIQIESGLTEKPKNPNFGIMCLLLIEFGAETNYK